MAETQCGIRENERKLDGIRDRYSGSEIRRNVGTQGTQDAVLGKKPVFGVAMTEARDAEMS